MKSNLSIVCFLISILWLTIACGIQSAEAQSKFFKFPVTESGIYKISSSDAQKWGTSTVQQLAIYGQKGMLPQELEETALELKEIPTWMDNDQLFVYLEAPNTLDIINDTLRYRHHYFADTAYYLIQTGVDSPKRITSSSASPVPSPESWLYQVHAYKKEVHNLLSSGRNWYSNKLFSGGISSFNISVSPYHQGPIYFQAEVMAQSFSPSELSIRSAQTIFTKMNVAEIPNATYGIKGMEAFSKGFVDHLDLGTVTSFNLEMNSAHSGGVGYLKYFLLGLPHHPDQLTPGIYFPLEGRNVRFSIRPNQQAWDVTDMYLPKTVPTNAGAGTIPSHHKLLILDPEKVRNIASPQNINLDLRHTSANASLVIIAPSSLLFQANRLAEHKNKTGIPTLVVKLEDLYNAYNYGTRDISAIRNFLADQFHKSGNLRNVLLFGKGTFDYKNIIDGRPNLIPVYSSRNSLDPLKSFSSDDYFGFLEMGQGSWQESEAGDHLLSVGVGRIPVINRQEAKSVVDKIIQYETASAQQGVWKRKLLFVADDADNNIHLRHSETHVATLLENHPEFIAEKLYLDNFEQVQENNYQSSPTAKDFLAKKISEGTFLVNYIGHGNENTLTSERLFQTSDIQNWPESPHFPIFMTATCEFGRQDSPFLRCGAEELLIAEKKGAIALLTTGRPVFSNINFQLNKAFINTLLQQDAGQYLLLGDIFKQTKNNSLNGPYNRNFSLIGDPSLRLPLPELNISPSLTSPELLIETDTLKAGSEVKIMGQVLDPLTGALVSAFDGEYLLDLYDGPVEAPTLGDEGPKGSFQRADIVLHRGTGKVKGGLLEARVFIKPDLHANYEKGSVRIYASDLKRGWEAMGSKSLLIGGTPEQPKEDLKGPVIRLFAEDSLQKVHTIPSSQVRLLAHLSDESGIQLAKVPTGQNITLKINEDAVLELNDHYRALLGDYRKGIIDLKVNGLKEGKNLLSLTAYDNYGNQSTEQLEIEVRGSRELTILGHTTYPNPTSGISYFSFTHNRPGENLLAMLSIYNPLGSKIFSMEKRYVNAGNEISDIEWFFLRDRTKFPAKGTYIYTLQLISEKDGTTDLTTGKILIQ
ncbi:type IX secretion system sortase PorU [Echinicola sediminis]